MAVGTATIAFQKEDTGEHPQLAQVRLSQSVVDLLKPTASYRL
jgi:hypothetical protein